MREIKFRAWIKPTKKMVDITCISFFDKIALFREDNQINDVRFELIDLMQFTGLHDRNGTEIYEGDILQMEECRGFVTFKGGILCVERRIPYNEGKYVPFLDWPAEAFEDCELIGNIFENPELLEDEG